MEQQTAVEKIATKNHLIDVSDVSRYIGRKLYAFNGSDVLAWAWNSRENCILFGPGGYGKSDAAVMFAEYLHEKGLVESPKPYVMAFGQGMTEERLLGGLDVKRFKEEGEIIYNLKRSFIEHEVVIFEEIWDAFPAVLLILKDILQSKCVRMGDISIPIKTKIVIACTNRSEEEVVTDNSTEALMQRFAFQREIVWKSHEAEDYLKSFMVSTGSSLEDMSADDLSLADICGELANGNKRSNKEQAKILISPRTAGKALASIRINGMQSLNGIYGFAGNIDHVMKKIEERKLDAAQMKLVNEILTKAIELHKSSMTMSRVMDIMAISKSIHLCLERTSNIRKRDENASKIAQIQSRIISLRDDSFNFGKARIKVAAKDSISEKILNSNASVFDYSQLKSYEEVTEERSEGNKDIE